MSTYVRPRHLSGGNILSRDPQDRARRHRELRQQVREGKLPLDEYLRVWVGVHPDYLEEVRPRFEQAIFHAR